MKLMERKLNEKENNNLVWSSNAQQDYYFGMDKDELINEIESMDEVEDFLRIRGYDDIEEADEDELRSFLLPSDIDLDYEDFTESVMPMIKEQCANDVLVLWGKAANWRGAYDAGAVIDVDEFKNYIYPDYDAISEIRSDNGNLYYIQYSHDTPMGGDTMYLYSFKSDELYDNACRICDEKDEDGDIAWLGEFKDDAGYAEIAKAIELGYLTPVTNRFNEGLEESTKKNLKEDINEDNMRRLKAVAEPFADALSELEDRREELYITWNFGFDKYGDITAGVDLRPSPRIRKANKTDELFKIILPKFEALMDEYGFELDSNIKHKNPSQNLSGGWHYQIKKVDDVDADVELTTDDMNGGQWYESLRKTESLNEGRYSDYADDETRANGWWYFTTHGVGPGSIPKDLNVLEVKEGQNKKGTWGDYVRLDGILNTDELDYYDMIELAPVEEEEDFSGFFSDYDFEESLSEDTIKTKDGKWVNKGKEGTHGKFKTKKEADAQRKAIFANWKK